MVGDLAVTSSGAHRAIRWLGHRTIDCRRHPRPADVMPIRISAHASGADQPARNLFVSPGHAICVDAAGEVLIPAGSLVNGSTIQQVEVDEITYWHVELDSHEIILAEGLPAESYLEMGNRSFFGAGDVVALHGNPDGHVPTHADFCRPFVDGGPLLEAVKARLGAASRQAPRGRSAILYSQPLDVAQRSLIPRVQPLSTIAEYAFRANARHDSRGDQP